MREILQVVAMEQKIILEMNQIAIQGPKIFLSKWYQSHKYLDMKKNHNSFFTKFFGKNATYYIYCISVSALSVLADMKNVILVFYWYRPIWKLSLSGFLDLKKKIIKGERVRGWVSGRGILILVKEFRFLFKINFSF